MVLRFGDIVLIEVPFHQMQGSKVRPAVVVLDAGDSDFVAAPITSRAGLAEFDLPLRDWRVAGLNVPSTVRIHKVAVLSKTNVRRTVGRLTEPDLASVQGMLCGTFCADRG